MLPQNLLCPKLHYDLPKKEHHETDKNPFFSTDHLFRKKEQFKELIQNLLLPSSRNADSQGFFNHFKVLIQRTIFKCGGDSSGFKILPSDADTYIIGFVQGYDDLFQGNI